MYTCECGGGGGVLAGRNQGRDNEGVILKGMRIYSC